MRIALLDDYQNVALSMAPWERLAPRAQVEAIHAHIGDPQALAARLRGVQAVVAMRERTAFSRDVFERLPDLRLLVTAGMANVAIDLVAATDHGVQVCGTAGWPYATAELALGLMLALARRLPLEDRTMRAGGWQTGLGMGLRGKTLGLIGLGNLGSQMARFGGALGMEVIAWSQNLTFERAADCGARLVSKAALLEQADVVSLHLKLSDRTRAVLGAGELAQMKPTSFLINTSRGPLVEEAALLAALQEGRIGGAGLDVFDHEPLPEDHPFRTLANVVLTPHMGYVVEQNYRIVYGEALDDIAAFLEGRVLRPLNTPKDATKG